MAMAAPAFFPIAELSSYQTKWTIRARVTSKGQLRTFAKGANPFKVFHVDLLDAQGGEIRANFFNQAAEIHFEKMQLGKCFTFSRGSVRIANRQYNTCNHRYEIVFDKEAQIEEAADDSQIETIKLTVTDLRMLRGKNLPCTVDLCGVIVSFKPTLSFNSRDGKELVKRELTVADDTCHSMTVTLWGDRARQEDKIFSGNAVVGLKGVVVKEWNGGRSGSLLEGGAMLLEPSMPEAQRVREWWQQGGSSQNLVSLSQESGGAGGSGSSARAQAGKAVSIAEMRKAADRVTEQEVFNVVGRLALVQMRKQGESQPLVYLACQEPKENSWPCNRRVDESGFCAACNRAGKVAPRLNLRCRFSDYEDSAWLTTFHEAAQRLLTMEAAEVQALEKGEGGREAVETAVRKRYFQQPMQVTVKAKIDSWNGEPRVNISCVDAQPVNLGEHGRVLLAEIREMAATQSTRAGGA